MYSYLYPTENNVLKIHDEVLRLSGGLEWVLHPWRLTPTIDFVKSDIYYPSFAEKIAYMMYSFIKNHCFVEGNKRTSLSVCTYFVLLNTNNRPLASQFMVQFEEIVVLVADNKISKELLTWAIDEFLHTTEYSESTLVQVYRELYNLNLIA